MKLPMVRCKAGRHPVVPRVGTWVEITTLTADNILAQVVPRVGTWVEMVPYSPSPEPVAVVPRVGTWVEIT